MKTIPIEILVEAIEWSVTRSQGAGGQHVNRTNSAVQLKLDIFALNVPYEVKSRLFEKLENRIVQSQYIHIRSETERDQKLNKSNALKLLHQLIEQALHIPKKRIKTKPKKSAVEKRLKDKNRKSEIKKNRQQKFD